MYKVLLRFSFAKNNKVIEVWNNAKNEVHSKLDNLTTRSQSLESTFGERASQIQDRITNLDSNFADKLLIVQDRITNLESNLTNKAELIKTQVSTLSDNVDSKSGRLENKLKDLCEQVAECKEELVLEESKTKAALTELIKSSTSDIKESVEQSKNTMKKFFISVIVLLLMVLCCNGYLILKLILRY